MKEPENFKIEDLSVLTYSEMRDVLGGRYDHLAPIGATPSDGKNTCIGKSLDEACAFLGVPNGGKCIVSTMGGGLYCSDMRQA